MMRLPFLILSLFANATLAADKPNIIVIVSDDMGYSDLGCYGGEIETPNLDALAARGVRFTNYYVNNMCWPTRASLMTGLYPKTALPKKGSAEGGLHPKSLTLPQALRGEGYATFMSGKWHLADPAELDGPSAPHHKGFDQFYGTLEGACDFFAPAGLQLNGQSMTQEWENRGDYYYTDAIVDHALEFLNGHRQGGKAGAPFFLYVAFTAAHWPLHAKPEDIEHYKGRYAMGWDELRKQRYERMKTLGVIDPDWELSPRDSEVPPWEEAENPEWQQRRMEVYAAQVTCMDRNIGRLVAWLKEQRQFDNTLILFHHDNGGCHVEYGPDRSGSWTRDATTDGSKTPIQAGNIPGLMPGPQSTFQSYGRGWANASNTPFRLFKQYDHEGGVRSPLIASWPDGIDHEIAGGWIYDVCHAIDVMPTLLEVVGAAEVRQMPFDFEGQSFANLLHHDPQVQRVRQPLFWEHNKGRAVRVRDWKLVGEKGGPWELYDLTVDGTELHDVSKQYPDEVEAMKEMHANWAKRTDLGTK